MATSKSNKRHPWTLCGYPRKIADWKGRKVVVQKERSNGFGQKIPAHSIVTITKAARQNNITIQADPCPTCGTATTISGIGWKGLTMLPEVYGQ